MAGLWNVRSRKDGFSTTWGWGIQQAPTPQGGAEAGGVSSFASLAYSWLLVLLLKDYPSQHPYMHARELYKHLVSFEYWCTVHMTISPGTTIYFWTPSIDYGKYYFSNHSKTSRLKSQKLRSFSRSQECDNAQNNIIEKRINFWPTQPFVNCTADSNLIVVIKMPQYLSNMAVFALHFGRGMTSYGQ